MKDDRDKEGKSKIEELKNRLHGRRFKSQEKSVRSTYYSRDPEVPSRWTKKEKDTEQEDTFSPTNPMLKKIFIASFAFFVITAGVAAYFFIGGGNVVSSENVDIEVLGPVSIAGGEELSLQVAITNNNNTELQFADLFVEFPEGAHDPSDIATELPRYRTSLDTVKQGETVNKIVRTILFGEEKAEKNIKIAVEYRVEGSNAIFVKEKNYTVSISSSPVSVTLNTLEEVNVNQQVELVAEVSSNSENTIRDLALQMQYPFGFEPNEANPEPTYGNDIWELGDIGPDDKKVIRITGTLRGQDSEERVFSAHVGKQDVDDERKIATVFSSSAAPVFIKKPFIGADLVLNDAKEDPFVVRAGETMQGRINWKSNLSERAENVVIEAELSGDVDDFSVEVTQGFYDSNEKKITWNQTTFEDLESIDSGDGGSLRFRLAPRTGADVSNPEIDIAVHISARRIAEQATPERVENVVQRTIYASSDLRLTSRGVHFAGPFENAGSMPPKAEDTTTYTILWTITNPENDISNAQVTAKLPNSVSWTGLTDPGGANISYDSAKREVTWNAGDIVAGAGFTSTAKQVAFQVAITPSVSSIGSTPRLVQDIELTGRDNFTNTDVSHSRPPITTNITTDPSFSGGQGQVVE